MENKDPLPRRKRVNSDSSFYDNKLDLFSPSSCENVYESQLTGFGPQEENVGKPVKSRLEGKYEKYPTMQRLQRELPNFSCYTEDTNIENQISGEIEIEESQLHHFFTSILKECFCTSFELIFGNIAKNKTDLPPSAESYRPNKKETLEAINEEIEKLTPTWKIEIKFETNEHYLLKCISLEILAPPVYVIVPISYPLNAAFLVDMVEHKPMMNVMGAQYTIRQCLQSYLEHLKFTF